MELVIYKLSNSMNKKLSSKVEGEVSDSNSELHRKPKFTPITPRLLLNPTLYHHAYKSPLLVLS
jgi:hypothetical protein